MVGSQREIAPEEERTKQGDFKMPESEEWLVLPSCGCETYRINRQTQRVFTRVFTQNLLEIL